MPCGRDEQFRQVGRVCAQLMGVWDGGRRITVSVRVNSRERALSVCECGRRLSLAVFVRSLCSQSVDSTGRRRRRHVSYTASSDVRPSATSPLDARYVVPALSDRRLEPEVAL